MNIGKNIHSLEELKLYTQRSVLEENSSSRNLKDMALMPWISPDCECLGLAGAVLVNTEHILTP